MHMHGDSTHGSCTLMQRAYISESEYAEKKSRWIKLDYTFLHVGIRSCNFVRKCRDVFFSLSKNVAYSYTYSL